MLKIGIPTVNCLRYLKETVASIKTSYNCELLIVDNGSNPETKSWVASYGGHFILNATNLGVAKAWNQILNWGMSFEDTRLILVMNNDLVLHPTSLDSLMQAVLEEGKEGVSGVNIGNTPDLLKNFTRCDREYRFNPAMNFSCFGLTIPTITRVGMFDEGFKLAYFEDNDYHHRMQLEDIDASCDSWAPFSHYGSRTIKEGGVKHHSAFEENRNYFKSKWNFLPGEKR